jgi:putative transposase
LPYSADWLSDNGSGCIARKTAAFAGDIGMISCRIPRRSPQSNGIAKAFVKAFPQARLRCDQSDTGRVKRAAATHGWFADYNLGHPHSALQYRSPGEFTQDQRALLQDERIEYRH